MAKTKTACEEAAEIIHAYALSSAFPELSKRLRAEGRDLKELYRIALNADSEPAYLTIKALIRMAKRIQKARK